MAYEVPTLIRGFKAAGDLSTKQYYFVKLSAANTVDVCSGQTDRPIGVLQNKPDAAGKNADVMIVGITKVSADAAITAGVLIGTSSDGQAETKTAGTNTTHYAMGQAIEAATAAGDLITATINGLNPHRAA